MNKEQAVAAVIIALISNKSKSRKNQKIKKSGTLAKKKKKLRIFLKSACRTAVRR